MHATHQNVAVVVSDACSIVMSPTCSTYALGNCCRTHFDPATSLCDDGYSLTARCVREPTGTFVLVFTVGRKVLTDSPAKAWSTATLLTCMICALGNC